VTRICKKQTPKEGGGVWRKNAGFVTHKGGLQSFISVVTSNGEKSLRLGGSGDEVRRGLSENEEPRRLVVGFGSKIKTKQNLGRVEGDREEENGGRIVNSKATAAGNNCELTGKGA